MQLIVRLSWDTVVIKQKLMFKFESNLTKKQINQGNFSFEEGLVSKEK